MAERLLSDESGVTLADFVMRVGVFLRDRSSRVDFAVLRGPAALARLLEGGDVDLLAADPAALEAELVAELGAPLRVHRRSYVTGLYFGLADGGANLDIVPCLGWRGVRFLETDQALARARVTDGVRELSLMDQAVADLLLSLLWGGFVKQRYSEAIARAAREDAFMEAATGAFGVALWRAVVEFSRDADWESLTRWRPVLLCTLVMRSLIRWPFRTISALGSFVAREALLRIEPPGMSVVLLGTDGSGKSAVGDLLVERAHGLFTLVQRRHLRPRILPSRTHAEDGVAPQPHAASERGWLASVGKLCYFVLDYWAGALRDANLLSKGALIVWDRHLVDAMIDRRRLRIGGPSWLVVVANAVAPKPDLVVVLDLPADVAFSRKGESTAEELDLLRSEYLRQAHRHRWSVVDANRPLECVVDSVMGAITASLIDRRGRRP